MGGLWPILSTIFLWSASIQNTRFVRCMYMFVVYNVELSDWCARDLIHPLLSFLYCVTSILTNFLTSPCICVAPWGILSLFFWTPWLGCLGSHIMSFLFLTSWSYHYSWDLKISFLSLNLFNSPGNQAQWLRSSTDCSALQVLWSVVVIKNVTFPLLFNYQFYLVLEDNRGIIIAKQRIQPLPLSVYFVLDSNQGIIIVKSYRLCGSLNGVVGCCNTYSNMTVQGVPKKRTFRMLLEPQCTGSITICRQPLCLEIDFLVVSY